MAKVILITGGTGSLGTALASHLLYDDRYSAIRLLTNSEDELVNMKRRMGQNKLRYMIGDIRDRDRLKSAMSGVDEVIHTAALKHVDICEYNPIESVKTNVLGSINIVDAATDCGVKSVIAISTDKAVHPINIYGATKLTMEKMVIGSNGRTKFSCIRFGNFEGSRGSVLPMWYGQVERGEALTITDKEMTRFWITIDKAAQFTIDRLNDMSGGEVFIPKMPEEELMETVKALGKDIEIEVIGRRAGEKLHEMLFAEGETPVDCGDYYKC